LKPSHSVFRLVNQTFQLGERVVCTVDHGNVPLGLKGTVISIELPNLSILLDEPIMGGSNLEGLCSDSRGVSIHKDYVLNLSNIQPPFSVDAPRKKLALKKNRPMHSPSPPVQNNWTNGPPIPMARQHPVAQNASDVEHLLMNMMHISQNGNGQNQASNFHSDWVPPLPINGSVMISHLNAVPFVPSTPCSYAPSWTPSAPVSGSNAAPVYDEMATQLLSILHNDAAAGQQINGASNDTTAPSNGRGGGRGRGRGGRGRGRGKRGAKSNE
jgi:Xrn1 SH3-like domain